MIRLFIGNPVSCKTVHALLLIVQALERGRSVYTNIGHLDYCGISDYVRPLFGLFPRLHLLEPVQAQEFWRHVEPGSLIVIDDFDSRWIVKEESVTGWYFIEDHRHEFFECWFEDHHFSETELILISDTLDHPARFFHHKPDDCAVHKIVNPEQIYKFFRVDFPFLRLRFYGYRGGMVDNSYLFFFLEKCSSSINIEWKLRRTFSLPRTLRRIESFFEEARFQSRLNKFLFHVEPGYGCYDAKETEK